MMRGNLTKTREIAAAQRGQAVQRILVDGWSPARAAASLGIDERRVMRWLAAYRRRGMASLRGDLAAEQMPRRLVGWVQSRVIHLVAMVRGGLRNPEAAPCVILRRTGDDRRRPR